MWESNSQCVTKLEYIIYVLMASSSILDPMQRTLRYWCLDNAWCRLDLDTKAAW